MVIYDMYKKLPQDDIKAYINFGHLELRKKQIVYWLITNIVISIPVAILGVYAIATSIVLGLCDLAFLIYSMKLLIKKNMDRIDKNMFHGVSMSYLAAILILLSYKILSINEYYSIIILITMFIFMGLVTLGWVFIAYRNIINGVYRGEAPKNKGQILGVMGGIAGYTGAMFYAKSLDQTGIIYLGAGLLYLLALLFSSGIYPLLKGMLEKELNKSIGK